MLAKGVCQCFKPFSMSTSPFPVARSTRMLIRRHLTWRAASHTIEPKTKGNSIFDSDESAWDHVFKDMNTAPRDLIANTPVERKTKRSRPQQMTAREVRAFGDMFDMIFQATSENGGVMSSSPDALAPGIGRKPSSEMSDLALHLRRHSRNVKWTSEADQELDCKKEEMDLCNTDQELLEWTAREVFGESQRYESQARTAIIASQQPRKPMQFQPASYPHLIAILMRTFRDKYADPYLALSIFDYAQHLSISSYVFGCTTRAYNELIETKWRCFRDLRGVCDAFEEMRVNGIEMDTRTRGLAELVRREVGERNLWEEETSVASGEVWEMVARIEQLTAANKLSQKSDRRSKKWSSDAESWKRGALTQNSREPLDWEFGGWEGDTVFKGSVGP